MSEMEISDNEVEFDIPKPSEYNAEELSDEEFEELIDSYRKRYDNLDLWQQIGFTRPLGGFFYNFVLAIIGVLIGLVFVGFLLSWLYPWPEAEGYRSIAGVYFQLMFAIFDIGTAYGIERFVAENRIKNPKKMLKYLQFFIWYQMITGLIQTTFVSLWSIFYITETTMAYLIWVFLILSTTQYPGCLGYFKAALKGLQQFDKTAVLDFIGQYFFQQATNVIFILLGRWWGAQNPAIGELMGLTIGAAMGAYIDDFFATIVSVYYFNKVVKKFGFSWKAALRHDFDKELVWECISFGVRVALGPLWGTFVGFTINMYWITFVPQWATFSTLSSIGRGIADLTKMGEGINLIPATSESFLNGKNKLAQFYIAQTFKYWTFFLVPMIFIIGVYVPVVIEAVLVIEGAENYALAAGFILPWLIFNLQENVTHTADHIIVGASKPNFLMLTRLLEETGKLLLMTTWIVWLKIPQNYGTTGVAWVVAMGIWPAVIAKTLAGWWYIHNKIVNVKVPWWQTFIAPLLASLVMVGFSAIFLVTIYPLLENTLGVLFTGVITLLVAFLVMFAFVYLGFYGFFGGYDDFGYKIFMKAADMSGPSKPLVKAIGSVMGWGIRISPLHNRFAIPSKYAELEAYELMYEREMADKELEKVKRI
ncbi:MAG: hypothetical protein GF364_04210 [Candidatus Lokiarchaeota archaeon]|nr:hypothetical protein [Candidatus Lokiarchaeota archaeon]